MLGYQRVRGRPFEAQGLRFLPWAERIVWRFPGGAGGFVWSRAHALEVEKEGRPLGRWMVKDTTRRAEYLVFAAGLAGVLAALIGGRRSGRRRRLRFRR